MQPTVMPLASAGLRDRAAPQTKSRSSLCRVPPLYCAVLISLAAVASAAQKPGERARPLSAAADPSVTHTTIINHIPAASGIYIGSPSIAVLDRGKYVTSHDEFGPRSTEHARAVTRVFSSSDAGQSWTQVSRIDGQFWSTLFTHSGSLYLLGTDRHHGHLVIRRSVDNGQTWTTPADSSTGLLRPETEYHCAPVPVVEHAGRLWRAVERRDPPTGWGSTYHACLISAPGNSDLLQATNWTFSDSLPSNTNWLDGKFGGWLEGNVVVTPEGKMADFLRVETAGFPEKAALVKADLAPGRAQLTFDPGAGFINFPGGAKKFTIRFDDRSKLYWCLVNAVPAAQQGTARPAAIRNTLTLNSSPDLVHWSVRRLLLEHPDVARHAFQYADWQFDGEDIIAACRTAYDDDQGGARDYHDANYLTFHRVANFWDLKAPDPTEKEVTHDPKGHLLANIGVWSPDSQWLAYDIRSDAAGEKFDGTNIEMVNVQSGEVRVLYQAKDGAHCGAPTFHPRDNKVVFILGPERPTPDWQYNPFHRRGVIVETEDPGKVVSLDARDLFPPFTPGALRGGTHLHVWEPAGDLVSFTYEDHVLSKVLSETPEQEINLRNIGVCLPGRPVRVPRRHPRNHDGEYFSVLVTKTMANPSPGSDEISRAFEEAWIGTNGYLRTDGSRQRRALAFQGLVKPVGQTNIAEVFIVDLPDDLTIPGDGPLQGTATRRPFPPRGARQRRLTFTSERKYPGLQGPRHWSRSAPDGSRIACLMKDDEGIVQIWTVSPNGGPPAQLTHNPWPIGSAFTWSPDGRQIAHIMDNSVCLTDTRSGKTSRLTERTDDADSPRPEACVFSPDGKKIAFVRRVADGQPSVFNQIFIVSVP